MQSHLAIVSLRACEAVSYYRMRLLTLRCAWARYAVVLRDCVTENSIMSLRACEAVSNYRMGLLTLRCAWARYAVVPRNDNVRNGRPSIACGGATWSVFHRRLSGLTAVFTSMVLFRCSIIIDSFQEGPPYAFTILRTR